MRKPPHSPWSVETLIVIAILVAFAGFLWLFVDVQP